MVRMAKQAAPIERLTRFADHIREHDVEAEKYGFQVQEASEFFKLYPKRKSPVKNQPEGVGFFRNERKEIFVLYKPRLHRVRRPTEVLNKMGQGWRQFKFTRKELGDKDFEMFYKYSQGLIPGRAEAQTFSSLLLVYYRHLNDKGEYEASESESEETRHHHHHHHLHPQVVPSSYYSPSASSSCSAASPMSSPASSSIGHSPSPSYHAISPSLSPVPMAAFAPPQFRSFQQQQQQQQQPHHSYHHQFQQQQQQQQQQYLSPFTLPLHTVSRSAGTITPPSIDLRNLNMNLNMNLNLDHLRQRQHHQFLPEISITAPVEEEEYGTTTATSANSFVGFDDHHHHHHHHQQQQLEEEQQQQQQQQQLHQQEEASSSSSSFEPATGSFGSHEFIGFEFEDFNGSGLMIEEIEDYSHISFV